MAETIAELSIAEIHESPTNPRRDFGDLTELAESIREAGVLQPVLVRPRTAGGYELVYGHRRCMASRQAGLETIPAMVRELDDQQVLEAQLVENSQRHDVCAVDEGDAIAELHRRFGVPTHEIAARLGRSKAFVLQRLKVAGLVEDAKVAVRNGKMHVAVALMLARLPEDQQREALDDLVDDDFEPASIASARALLERNYMLRLDDSAGFDPGDADLVRDAGACTVCPKRSGTQLELLGSLSSPDLCTDAACFNAKKEAGWQKRAAEHRAKGLRVLSDEEGKNLFRYGSHPSFGEFRDAGLVPLDVAVWSPEDGRSVTARERLGPDVTVVLARDANGRVHELAERPKEKASPAKTKADRLRERELEKQRFEREIRDATDQAVSRVILDHLVADKDDARVWRLVAALAVDCAASREGDALERVALAMGVVTDAELEPLERWDEQPEFAAKRLHEELGRMNPGDHREVIAGIFLHSLGESLPDSGGTWPSIVSAVHAYGIDVEAIEDQERQRLTPTPTKAKAKASKKKGTVAADA